MKTQDFRRNLSNLLDCEVLWDKEILSFYSVDSSSYKVKPKVIVIPKKIQDVIKTIKFSLKHKIPVTVRGAGTGLVGGAIGNGIILDLKNFNSISVKSHAAEVGAGVLKGKLDIELRKFNKFLGPNPSVGPFCSIGGMIGANASGSRSLKYGSMIDNLLSIKFVSGLGELIELPKDKKYGKEIVKISKLVDKKNFPPVTKNSSGYRLDQAYNLQNSHKVIAASEGTLGIIISAKIKLFSNPSKRVLFIVGFNSNENAAKNCKRIVELEPSAIEFLDNTIMKKIKHKFSDEDNCLLFIEFDSDLKNKIMKFNKIIKGKIYLKINKESEIKKWWKYRDCALSISLKSLLKTEHAPHIIEDATVPIDVLPELIKLIIKLRELSAGRVIVYGHAGNGNLHVRLFSKNKNKNYIKKMATFYFSNVMKLGGTISGEHGDGFARSEFVKKQYGPKNYLLFQKLKKKMDPHGILNPNKKITKKSTILKNLQI